MLDGDIPDLLIDDAETVDDAEARPAHEEGREPTASSPRSSSDPTRWTSSTRSRGCPSSSRPRTRRRRRCTPTRFPKADPIRNIVVLGMGGSGISGDVVAAAFNDELPVPVRC